MKKFNSIILYTISLYALISCHCKTCTDNITEANKKIPYINKQVIPFSNDTLGIDYDTVNVSIGSVSKASYGCSGSAGDAEQKYCNTFSEISFTNFFSLYIIQSPNSSNNVIFYNTLKYHNEVEIKVSYSYKNETLNAIHFFTVIDTLGSKIWEYYQSINADTTFVYNDYYYTTDKTIKLLQYSKVYRDGKHRVFRLKE